MVSRASPASLYGTTAVARDIVGAAVAGIWGGRIKAKVWWCDAGGGKEFRQEGRATVVPGRSDDLPGCPICDRYVVRLDASKHSTFGCAKQIILKFRFRQLRYFCNRNLGRHRSGKESRQTYFHCRQKWIRSLATVPRVRSRLYGHTTFGSRARRGYLSGGLLSIENRTISSTAVKKTF